MHPVEYAGSTVQDKVGAIQQQMKEVGATLLLTSLLDEVAWLLNVVRTCHPYKESTNMRMPYACRTCSTLTALLTCRKCSRGVEGVEQTRQQAAARHKAGNLRAWIVCSFWGRNFLDMHCFWGAFRVHVVIETWAEGPGCAPLPSGHLVRGSVVGRWGPPVHRRSEADA